MNMNEKRATEVVWRDVVGFENAYEVSSEGRVRRKETGRILSMNSRVGRGYVKCDLHYRGKAKQTSVHRVVCEAFKGPPLGREVNHIDGNKANNRVENLEWVTRAENVNHSYYTLGNQIGAVGAVDEMGGQIIYRSVEEAVRAGFDSAHIYRCLGDYNRRHKGFRWYRPLPPAAAHGDEAVPNLVPGLQWAIDYCNAMLRQGNDRMLVEVIRTRLENARDIQPAAMRAQAGKDGSHE